MAGAGWCLASSEMLLEFGYAEGSAWTAARRHPDSHPKLAHNQLRAPNARRDHRTSRAEVLLPLLGLLHGLNELARVMASFLGFHVVQRLVDSRSL